MGNVKRAGKKGSEANPASTLVKGLVPKNGTRRPKGKSALWRHRSEQLDGEAESTGGGENPLQDSPLQDMALRRLDA